MKSIEHVFSDLANSAGKIDSACDIYAHSGPVHRPGTTPPARAGPLKSP